MIGMRASALIPALILALAGLGLAGCRRVETGEETYPGGGPKTRFAFVRNANGDTVRHGPAITWYPGGQKESMETYVDGSLQGYVLRWYPDGRLESAEHFTDGVRDGQAKYWDAAGGLAACYDARAGDCLHAAAPRDPNPGRMAEGP